MPTSNRIYPLTSPAASAIAVLRLVGPGVDAFLAGHFGKPVPVGRCVHGTLREGNRIIDDPVIVRVAREVIDINLHGGPWVVRSTIQLAVTDGFIEQPSALPLSPDSTDGESIIWTEVLQSLPLGKTAQSTRMLLAQPAAWDKLNEKTAEEIQQILNDRSGHWLIHPPTVAIIGPPNVGKSTLANQLFAQDRSITADLPGTTRDWVGEIANLDGLAVMLVDTPGVRKTEDAIEHAAIQVSSEKIRSADLVLIVLDQSAPITAAERAMLNQHPSAIVIANKSDAPPAWNAEPHQAIRTIAVTGVGIDAVRSAIRHRFDCEPIDLENLRCWTDRQRGILTAISE